MPPDRFLIVTADDFGLHESINEAVELASRAGTLSAASIMMGAPATADAVRRAHELPGLRIGLHLVLTDGTPVLPPDRIPALVNAQGRFRSNLFTNGARYFLSLAARRQLETEIRAQFEAFAATGLTLDHVNAHNHFHSHPTVLGMMLRIGREFGLQAMRLPYEPAGRAGRLGWFGGLGGYAIQGWFEVMKRRLQYAGVLCNDWLYGIRHTGAMNESRLLERLRQLPLGVTEIYLHPATESGAAIAHSMRDYDHREELAALRSPRVRAALAQLRIACGGYADLALLQSQRYAA
jgi:hopanoid biosynthesis associated protein HpnK